MRVGVDARMLCSSGIGKVIENAYFSKLGGLDTAFHKLDRNKEKPHIVLENKNYKVNIYSSYDDVVIFTSNCPPFGMEMNNGNIQEKHSPRHLLSANTIGRVYDFIDSK